MPLNHEQERTLSILMNNGREIAINDVPHTLEDSSFFTLLVRHGAESQAEYFAAIMTALHQLDNFERLEQANTDSNNQYNYSDIAVEAQYYRVPDFARSLIEMAKFVEAGDVIYHSGAPDDLVPCPAVELLTASAAASVSSCIAALLADETLTANSPVLLVHVLNASGTTPPSDGGDCCEIIDGGIIIVDPPDGGYPPGGGGPGLPPGVRPPVKDPGTPGNGGTGSSEPEQVDLVCDDHIIYEAIGTNTTKPFPELITSGESFIDFLISFGIQSLIPIVPVLDIATNTIKTLIDAEIATLTGIPAHTEIVEVDLGYNWVALWSAKITIPTPVPGVSVTVDLKRDRLPPLLGYYRNNETTTQDVRKLPANNILNMGQGVGRISIVNFNYGMSVGVASEWQHITIPTYDKLTAIALNTLMLPAVGFDESFDSTGITDTPYMRLALCGVTVKYAFHGYYLKGNEPDNYASDPNVTHPNFDGIAFNVAGSSRWATAGGALISGITHILLEITGNPDGPYDHATGVEPAVYGASDDPSGQPIIAWANANGGGFNVYAQAPNHKYRYWVQVPATNRDEFWHRSHFGDGLILRLVGVRYNGKDYVEDLDIAGTGRPTTVV